MSPDTIFQHASTLAIAGWVILLLSPFLPRFADLVSGVAIPALLSVVYTGLILAFWSTGEGGFDTLDNVAMLFQTRELLLAGWIHYLAFDLFVGGWIVRHARANAIPFWLVLPCLPLTFLFGPAGFLAYTALRLVLERRGAGQPATAL